MLTLSVVTTLDDWEVVMYAAMDGAGVDKQPVMNNSSWAAVYFILFVICSGLVWFNIFVGVVVNTYSQMQTKSEGKTFVTDQQRKFEVSLKIKTYLGQNTWMSKPPRNYLGFLCWKLSMYSTFEYFMYAMVCFSTISLATIHDGQSNR
ncbi:hypothetical protein CYMTET_18461 [Cymbomonas tetramitiformis]|uniref:Ion transport domain-containing protein n=1 Tax=Cymbomonas tetramitiformis TaxID=36881 RepID=A0AAE0L5W5_9CHLO|nr:hypothetical protein CYMTET_18461 [Cymbomonas tetramitiformis]